MVSSVLKFFFRPKIKYKNRRNSGDFPFSKNPYFVGRFEFLNNHLPEDGSSKQWSNF